MFLIKNILFSLTLLLLTNCHQPKEKKTHYEDQIGNTPFDQKLDDPNFKLCDPTDALHKRAFVRYEGGWKAIEQELRENYVSKSAYQSYSGYFVIRLAVNCNDEVGRYRMQTLDTNFNLAECPKELEQHILAVVKKLKKWKHPFYDNKDYDGYKFLTIKLIKGQII